METMISVLSNRSVIIVLYQVMLFVLFSALKFAEIQKRLLRKKRFEEKCA